MKKCVLCNQSFEGYGNNPEPLSDKGRCCDICNDIKVIPARLNIEIIQNPFLTNSAKIIISREDYKTLLKRLLSLDNDKTNQQFYNHELQRIK